MPSYNATLTDSVAVVEVLSRYVTRSYADTVSVADSVAKGMRRILATDAFTLADTFGQIRGRFALFSESVAVADVFGSRKPGLRTVLFTDSVPLGESNSVFGSFTDTFTLTEAFSTIRARFRTLTDSVPPADQSIQRNTNRHLGKQ